MGFFDRDVRNGFDSMFDFDRNGKLDTLEQAMQFEFLDRASRDDFDTDEGDEYEEIMDEIEGMDEEEARDYLESEGYDPDDFDF